MTELFFSKLLAELPGLRITMSLTACDTCIIAIIMLISRSAVNLPLSKPFVLFQQFLGLGGLILALLASMAKLQGSDVLLVLAFVVFLVSIIINALSLVLFIRAVGRKFNPLNRGGD